MTDRQRFEAKALEMGATVVLSAPTVLEVIATDGKLFTRYFFNEDGSYEFNTHTILKKLIKNEKSA